MRFFQTIFVILYFLSLLSSVNAEVVKVAFFDTSFCIKKISTPKSVTIHSTTFFSKDYIDCPQNSHQGMSHGHDVLKTFIHFLNNKNKTIEIYPMNVFEMSGEQNEEYWNQSLSFINDHQIDLLILASGLIERTPKISFKGIVLAASPTQGKGISDKTFLWPQSLQIKNMVLFGTFSATKLPNGTATNYLNKSLILPLRTAFLVNDKIINSSSMAVAYGSALFINHCSLNKSPKECLKSLSKPITVRNYENIDLFQVLPNPE